jgi:hypothetical protein
MNVQAGDVAVIIKGRWPNVGRIVYVAHQIEDKDYSQMGYGVLPTWYVESLGGELDTDIGPQMGGTTPDLSLRRIPDITPGQAAELRRMKNEADKRRALADLKQIIDQYAEEEELAEVKANP